jgi:hypothetical protein
VRSSESGDCRCRGARRRRGGTGAGEELGQTQHAEVDEYAGQREREELGAQQPVPVDDGVPGLADAAAHGQAARRQAAEHVRERRACPPSPYRSTSICRMMQEKRGNNGPVRLC